MARVLKQAVLAGGRIYPAGTPATVELEAEIPAQHWSGGDPVTPVDPGAGQDSARVRAAADRAIAERDQRIAGLTAEAERLTTENETLRKQLADDEAEIERLTTENETLRKQLADVEAHEPDQAGPPPADDEATRVSSDYAGHTPAELKAEITARNDGRDEASQIEPTSKRKPDLVAALEADDARTPPAGA